MSNQETDPHTGGDLFDMAKDGTTMPNDAGKMNLIPSVPRPGEGEGVANGNRAPLAGAASNATDISRGVDDMGATGEVETGTGDQLPASIESKRLHFTANNPLAKGHDRNDKHVRHNKSEFEQFGREGAEMDQVAGEEDGVVGEDRKV